MNLLKNFTHQIMSSNTLYSFLLALIMWLCDYFIAANGSVQWHEFALALLAFVGNYASTEYNKFDGKPLVPTTAEQPKQ